MRGKKQSLEVTQTVRRCAVLYKIDLRSSEKTELDIAYDTKKLTEIEERCRQLNQKDIDCPHYYLVIKETRPIA